MKFLFIIVMFMFSCNSVMTSEEIYTCGKVANWNDFIRIDTLYLNTIDPVINYPDSLLEKYIYKYDENLKVYKMFTFDYNNNIKVFRNYAFLYKGKQEGKFIFYNLDGSYFITFWYHEDSLIKVEKELNTGS